MLIMCYDYALQFQVEKRESRNENVSFLSLSNNRMVRGGLAPRDIWGWIQGVGLVQGVTRSGLVCDAPSARSADVREARFLVEYALKSIPGLADVEVLHGDGDGPRAAP